MHGNQTASLIFFAILALALIGSYVAHSRLRLSQVAQQAMIWVLIFVGAIAGYGLWQDMKHTIIPNQAAVYDNEVRVKRGIDGHFHLTLDVNGQPIAFLVDTGATDIVLDPDDAKEAGLPVETLAYTQSAMTANGMVRTAPVRLDQIQLGNFSDQNVRASVNSVSMGGSLLGMSYLRRFDSLSIEGDTLILRR